MEGIVLIEAGNRVRSGEDVVIFTSEGLKKMFSGLVCDLKLLEGGGGQYYNWIKESLGLTLEIKYFLNGKLEQEKTFHNIEAYANGKGGAVEIFGLNFYERDISVNILTAVMNLPMSLKLGALVEIEDKSTIVDTIYVNNGIIVDVAILGKE